MHTIVRILLVDDFKPWRIFIPSILEKQADWCIVGEGSDGVEAVQKAEELKPDLILLDIGLPKLNGIEAARQIRQLAPNSKILFVSAIDSPNIAREALRVGAGGYVVKLDAGNELLKAMEAVMEGKQFVSSRLKESLADDLEGATASDRPRLSEILSSPSARARSRRTDITRHEVRFYSDDACFVDSFAHFVGAALKVGQTAIVIATESHREGVLQKLQERGLDIAAAVQEGRYIALDAVGTLSTFMVNGMPDPVRFFSVTHNLLEAAARAAKSEHPRVVACGEIAPTLWAQGNAEAAVRLEQLWDALAKAHDLATLCGYPTRSFRGDEDTLTFRRICAEHSVVGLVNSFEPGPMELEH